MEKKYTVNELAKKLKGKLTPGQIYYLIKINKLTATKEPVNEFSKEQVYFIAHSDFERLKKYLDKNK